MSKDTPPKTVRELLLKVQISGCEYERDPDEEKADVAIRKAEHQLNQIRLKDRQNELAKTCLGGMPELTPRQQEFITERIKELEALLNMEEKNHGG